MQKTSFEFFCLKTEKIRYGTLRCFRKFQVSKNFMHKKGISLFSVEFFSSHSTEKLRGGTLLCFRKFMVRKKLWIRGGGGVITFFRRKFFVSHSAKKHRGEPFCVSEMFWYQNFFG